MELEIQKLFQDQGKNKDTKHSFQISPGNISSLKVAL